MEVRTYREKLLRGIEAIAEATEKRNQIEEDKRVELKRIRIELEALASECVGRAGG